MLESIKEFLSERPGYRKEGAYRLSKILQKHGIDVSVDECKAALYDFNKDFDTKETITVENEDVNFIDRLVKSNQRYKDMNRLERRLYRNRTRMENALKELNKALIASIKEEGLGLSTKSHSPRHEGGTIIAQLSDPHFNELINLEANQYNFEIASKRLKKYAGEIKMMAEARGSAKVIVALTGDLINSDRRPDEILQMATSRAKASILATKLIASFIKDINEVCNVDVISVSGNESRIKDDWALNDLMLSDNYDYLIFNMLKLLMGDSDGINFIISNPFESVISVNAKNILLTHVATFKKNTQDGIQQIIGKFAVQGIHIDYILFGHVHFANVTDIYARSGSLVGLNNYSDRDLNLITIASQTMTIVEKNGDIHNMRVSLQNTDDIKGYSFMSDVDAYDLKHKEQHSLKDNTKIIKIND